MHNMVNTETGKKNYSYNTIIKMMNTLNETTGRSHFLKKLSKLRLMKKGNKDYKIKRKQIYNLKIN